MAFCRRIISKSYEVMCAQLFSDFSLFSELHNATAGALPVPELAVLKLAPLYYAAVIAVTKVIAPWSLCVYVC